MFKQQTWFHGTIRKYVIMFGTLFNDIHINRTDEQGHTIQTIKVPLNYGPKDKTLARITGDPDLKRPVSITAPRMSFEIRDMHYDSERKLNSLQKIVVDSNTSTSRKLQYVPVPYNFTFELSIFVKNAEDGTRIVEQILPFFTPDWSNTVELVPSMGIKMDIPVVLVATNMSDNYEGDYESRRMIQWTLTFMVKGYLFGPVKNQKIITLANTSLYVPSTNTAKQGVGSNSAYVERVIITPGMTANGTPTTDKDLTIDRNLINKDDNWDFIIDFQRGDDDE